MTALFAPTAGLELQERVVGILMGVAVKRGTITYTALGNMLGLTMTLASSRAKLGELLDAAATFSRQEFGVVLPALVVGGQENMPSGRRIKDNPSGFYRWCVDNGLDVTDPYKLVIDEQRKVYNRFRA